MVAPASLKPERFPDSPPQARYGVELLGRLYPMRLRPEAHPPQLDAERQRNTKVAERIRDTLPWFQRPEKGFACVEDMVRCYEDNLRLVSMRYQEVTNLLRQVCTCSLTVDIQESGNAEVDHEAVLNKLREERFKLAALAPLQQDAVLSAALLTRPPSEVYKRLSDSLVRSCHRVVACLFDALDRLVDQSVVGLIEWKSPTLCLFHYFRESSTYRAIRRVSVDNSEYEQDDDTVKVKTTTVGHDETEKRYRRRHEHHVMEAESLAPPATGISIPREVQPVVDSIPSWLYPESRTVSGTLFREDLIEQELKDREWRKERVVRREIKVEPDPAIVIERFVLAGWGELETRLEEQRRTQCTREAEKASFVQEHHWTLSVARWTTGIGLTSQLLSHLGSTAFSLLAVIMFVAAVAHAYLGLRNAVLFCNPRQPGAVYLFGTAARVLFCLGGVFVIEGLCAGSIVCTLVGAFLAGAYTPLMRQANAELGAPVFPLNS